MSQPILSHAFPNGLLLVAQPMQWLQSAAFTLTAGLLLRPIRPRWIQQFHLRDGPAGGWPAQQPPIYP